MNAGLYYRSETAHDLASAAADYAPGSEEAMNVSEDSGLGRHGYPFGTNHLLGANVAACSCLLLVVVSARGIVVV